MRRTWPAANDAPKLSAKHVGKLVASCCSHQGAVQKQKAKFLLTANHSQSHSQPRENRSLGTGRVTREPEVVAHITHQSITAATNTETSLGSDPLRRQQVEPARHRQSAKPPGVTLAGQGSPESPGGPETQPGEPGSNVQRRY